MSSRNRKFGINDSNDQVRWIKDGVRAICPAYAKWDNMLYRCFSGLYQDYDSVSVCDEWMYFSNFKKWFISLSTEDNSQLDKDLISGESKIYSPETCCLISGMLNKFIAEKRMNKGICLTGVFIHKQTGKYRARINNPLTGKPEHLGLFSLELDAHLAWKRRKHELACQLADLQADERVSNALRTRYL